AARTTAAGCLAESGTTLLAIRSVRATRILCRGLFAEAPGAADARVHVQASIAIEIVDRNRRQPSWRIDDEIAQTSLHHAGRERLRDLGGAGRGAEARRSNRGTSVVLRVAELIDSLRH